MTIIKRESAAMGYTRGRLACIGCQSFQKVTHTKNQPHPSLEKNGKLPRSLEKNEK
jgi:hypothetical protein